MVEKRVIKLQRKEKMNKIILERFIRTCNNGVHICTPAHTDTHRLGIVEVCSVLNVHKNVCTV